MNSSTPFPSTGSCSPLGVDFIDPGPSTGSLTSKKEKQNFLKVNSHQFCFSLFAVARLGFEPKTPTLKVLCSTN